MSTSSPQPSQTPGTLEAASSPKSRVRITVLTILALHVVVIGGLLLQGCDKRSGGSAAPTNSLGSLPSLVEPTNLPVVSIYPGDPLAPGGGAAASGTSVGGPGPGDSQGAVGSSGAGALTGQGSGGVPPLGGSAPSTFGTPGAGGTGGAGLAPLNASTLPTYNATGAGAPLSEHIIQKGDTLGALAKKYKVTEKALIEANPTVKPRSLKIQDRLVIPAPATPAPAAASSGGAEAAAAPGASGEVYVVKPGDTLARIAKRYGVSLKALRGANNIRGDRIIPKQKLTIPTKAVPTTQVDPATGRPSTQP